MVLKCNNDKLILLEYSDIENWAFLLACFDDGYWFPMVKRLYFPNFKAKIPNTRGKNYIKNHLFVISSLHCATANCIFAFQILKSAFE